MAALFLHNRPVKSIFSLLGDAENDITYSIGWALAHSPGFLQYFVKSVVGETHRLDLEQVVVSLQEFRKNSGITDIEIRDATLHIIVEAKRGWEPPDGTQLRRYLRRFGNTLTEKRFLA